jgi:hypothetical protein
MPNQAAKELLPNHTGSPFGDGAKEVAAAELRV